MSPMNDIDLSSWLEQAATYSYEGSGVSRLFLTKEHKALISWLEKQMSGCGLETELDDSGNLLCRKKSRDSDKTLYLGSHQDTVPHGGKYDGMLGILVALMAVSELEGTDLPFNIEIIAFGDEEGIRFNSTLLGSAAIAGCFDSKVLTCVDDRGITLHQALVEFGLDPEKIPSIARKTKSALGYLEVHIEQGPILEHHNLPVGIVSAITGIERHSITITGQVGHAGTVPMHMRKDALVAAAEYTTWLDNYCRATEDVVGVVGKIDIQPNSVNVIPGVAELTLELRSPNKPKRLEARKEMAKITAGLIERGFIVESQLVYSLDEMDCDKALSQSLKTAIAKEGITPLSMFSGAGHDGLAMGNLCPIAMLFVRCRDGLSHHPEEAIEINDALIAKDVVKNFIIDLASTVDR